MRYWGRFMHQFHVAVGASRKPLPVLRFALWTIHSAPSLLHLGLPTHRRGVEISPLLPPASLSPQIYLQLFIDKYGTYIVIHSVIISRQHNRSASCFRLPASSRVTKSPVVHPLSIQQFTKCFFSNSFVLKAIHLSWGVVYPVVYPPLALPTTLIPSTAYPHISYPFFFIPWRTLSLFLHSCKTQLLSFLAFPHSSQKTTRRGGTPPNDFQR